MGQAKVKRENERLRDEVVKAAVQWASVFEPGVDATDAELDNSADALLAAVKVMLNRQSVSDAPADPNTMFCPHCDAERPGYNWRFNQGDVGTFAVACVTCVCAECKNILSVTAIGFQPHAQLAEQLKRQFLSKNLQGFEI